MLQSKRLCERSSSRCSSRYGMKEGEAHQEEGPHEHDRNPEEAGDEAEKHPHLPMKHTAVRKTYNGKLTQYAMLRHSSTSRVVPAR